MKTDSLFYRIFQQYPRSFFDLLNCPPSDAENYQFSSVEVKQLSFRLDGIFLPTDDTAERPFYLVEVQFQPDDSLYFRIFAELFVYLRQYQPPHPWRVAVIYPTRNIEREHPHQFRELLASNRVFRLYLDELDTCEDRLGVEIVKLVVVSEDRAIEAARRLLTKTQQTLPTSSLQRELLDLIETIVIYKLPQLSREEIAT
ncbi:flagellar assembly protein H, partial [Leptolyngbya valderiana BDU 20041]